MTRTLLRRHAWNLTAAGVLLLIYLAVLRVMPQHVFWSPDEGIRFITLHTIHWDKGLTYALPYRGAVIDPEFKFYPSRCAQNDLYPSPLPDGTIGFRWPIWFPLASRVFFVALGVPGVYWLPLISGWLTAVLAGGLASQHHPRLGPLAILLVGLGTPVFFYSMCFWEHTVATFFGMLAVTLLVRSRPGRTWTAWVVLPALSVAVLLRVEMLAFAGAVLFTWALDRFAARHRLTDKPTHDAVRPQGDRRRLRMSYVAATGLALALLFVGARSLTPRHLKLLALIPQALFGGSHKLRLLPNGLLQVFISGADPQAPAPDQTWEWLTLIAAGGVVFTAFVRSRRLEARLIIPCLVVLLEFSLLTVLSSRAYLSRHGVLLVAPYLVVGLYVLPDAWRQRDGPLLSLAAATVLYVVTGFLVLFAFRINWDATYQIGLDGGARYMLTLYPAGATLSLIALHRYRNSDRQVLVKATFTALVAALMLIAVQYQLRGVEMLYNSKQLMARWEKALPEHEPIITDAWWLAACLAPFFTSHEMYCVREPEQLAEWLPAATAHGITTFTFASFGGLDGKQLSATAALAVPEAYHFVEGIHLTQFRVTGSETAKTEWRRGNQPDY